LPSNNLESDIVFFADKLHVHHWPSNSPIWSKSTKEKVDQDLNKNPNKKKIMIQDQQLKINEYEFNKIKKIGITVPLFKNQTTLVFEGHFEDFDAHVHVTTSSQNYVEIFNKLVIWKDRCFPESS
jgi:hypothetical protein